MNYREVKCSDRLPKADAVNVITFWSNGTVTSEPAKVLYETHRDFPYHPYLWLEPYEIPTEGDIVNVLEHYQEESGGIYSYNHKWIAKAIFNLLKGER